MTEKEFPQHARVVIIGGGIIGCSVAYHLTKRGWTDVGRLGAMGIAATKFGSGEPEVADSEREQRPRVSRERTWAGQDPSYANQQSAEALAERVASFSMDDLSGMSKRPNDPKQTSAPLA